MAATKTGPRQSQGERKRPWHGIWHRLFRALLGGVIGAGMSVALQAEAGLVTADRAPQAWLAYAALVQTRIEDALVADDALLHQLQQSAESAVIARIWVNTEGRISAVALAGQASAGVEPALQARLIGLPISQTPPSGLRWPIVLQLDWSGMQALDASTQPALTPSKDQDMI